MWLYLGIQAIRHRSDARIALASGPQAEAPRSTLASLRIGFGVGATNPKTIVFFVAFLPQFIDSSGPAAPQLMLLGLIFGVMAIASDTCWALAASRARDWFARRPQRLDHLSVTGGVMMVGLGAGLAATGNTSH